MPAYQVNIQSVKLKIDRYVPQLVVNNEALIYRSLDQYHFEVNTLIERSLIINKMFFKCCSPALCLHNITFIMQA